MNIKETEEYRETLKLLNKIKMEQGNIKIAVFDGAYHCNDDLNNFPEGYWMNDIKEGLPLDSKDFRYDISLGWIMPVFEKISRFSNWNGSINISQSKPAEVIIFDNDYKFTGSGKRFVKTDYEVIEAIWDCVILFIDHYNENKK